jgi:hypothetical protein
MRIPSPLAALVAALLAVPAAGVSAQNNDIAAFFALTFTPTGALPPMLTPSMVGDVRGGSDVLLRYGRYTFRGSDEAIHNLGVTLDLPTQGATRFGLTAGFQACDGCDGLLMIGGDFHAPLVRAAGPTPLAIGLEPSVGLGRGLGDDAGTAVSAALGLPVSLTASLAGGGRLIPFLTPGAGFGLITDDGDSESGIRFTLGGGVGFYTDAGVGINLGYKKIFIDDGPTQWGVGVAFRTR